MKIGGVVDNYQDFWWDKQKHIGNLLLIEIKGFHTFLWPADIFACPTDVLLNILGFYNTIYGLNNVIQVAL